MNEIAKMDLVARTMRDAVYQQPSTDNNWESGTVRSSWVHTLVRFETLLKERGFVLTVSDAQKASGPDMAHTLPSPADILVEESEGVSKFSVSAANLKGTKVIDPNDAQLAEMFQVRVADGWVRKDERLFMVVVTDREKASPLTKDEAAMMVHKLGMSGLAGIPVVVGQE